jgi:hypothetical protein
MKLITAVMVLAGAGGGIGAAEGVPLPRPRPSEPPAWIEPHSFEEAAGPGFDTASVTSTPTACDGRLAKISDIAFLPRLIGPDACGGSDMIELDAVLLADKSRIEIKPAPVVQCPFAEQLAGWLRDDAAPRIAALGASLRTVETFDDFECRPRNRQANGKLSEHGKGNAVDVRAFALSNGTAIALTDVNAPKDLRESLRTSACARFTTVLGPGSDSSHESHVHLDLLQRSNGYRICQWDVREPPAAQVASTDGNSTIEPVPLPVPRPPIPAGRKARKL